MAYLRLGAGSMRKKRTIRDVELKGRKVLVRVDFNVPLDRATNAITDDSRVRAALPTIRHLLDHGAAVILASHLGRPGGRFVPGLSLRPLAERLGTLLGTQVLLAPDSVGPEVECLVAALQPGQVLLLENVRFHPEEEANDPEFARRLAGLADLYVNDAFGTAHRAHASTAGVAAYLPAVSGFLVEREIEALGGILTGAEHPLVAVIGGAKISTKIGVLEQLLGVADAFVIGGGMANTLLLAQGIDVGASLVERDRVDTARSFLSAAGERGRPVHLPGDAVVARDVEAGAEHRVVPVGGVPPGWSIVDIGPRTIEAFAAVVGRAAVVIWNGPMGVFEAPPFDRGTRAMAAAVAASPARTVVGGGDSVAAIEATGLADRMYHISTGGGAALEFLEGRALPGVGALEDATEEVA